MDMKKIKNLRKRLCVVVLALCLSVLSVCEVSAAAKFPSNGFDLSSLSSSGTSASFNLYRGNYGRYADYVQLGLFDKNGKMLKYTVNSSYASFSGLKTNKLYYYKGRGVVYNSSLGYYVATTGWSSKKAFCTARYKNGLVSRKSRNVYFKFPKVSGVKAYKLYISTKKTSGYKKVATVKPGKQVVIKKFCGKPFQYYKDYYFYVTPILSSGTKCDSLIGNGFRITRTYR